jgi:predicted phosphoribosyltransferase
MTRVFADRSDAGRRLARALRAYANRTDLLVLALPRGGVPVAFEVAQALRAPLDLLLVRKLGVPGHEELAMGAIASGGIQVLNREVIAATGVGDTEIQTAVARERRELERRETAYRGERPAPEIAGRCVILVDDGLATGATMRAALAALRPQHPAALVVAVPVAPPDVLARLRAEADDLVCVEAPESFFAIGAWYRDFGQLDDDRVRDLLARAWAERPGSTP